MYSESDLAQAVDAGVLSPDAAEAFRSYIAGSRSAPAVDEEHFRLLSGFNDIFVAIAAVLMLGAAARLGAAIGWNFIAESYDDPRYIGAGMIGGGFTVALLAWALGEYFTRRRRMALPSIVLLLAWVGGMATGFAGLFAANAEWLAQQFGAESEMQQRQLGGAMLAAVAVLTALAAAMHWRRFMVPITVAAGAAALVGILVGAALALIPNADAYLNPMLLGAGVLLFLFAMRWDMSDRERRTRRSDVAFWLHLAAAPLIAHPVFHMLGVFDGAIAVGTAAIVIGLYVLFAVIALAVDRRALLVSSLAYVLYAMYALLTRTGAVELGAALTALVIGSALLTLSAFWQPMRRGVVNMLGGLRHSLPPVQRASLA